MDGTRYQGPEAAPRSHAASVITTANFWMLARCAVFGLSSQPTEYQQEVADRLHLPFGLLSDVTLELAKQPGLPTFQVEDMTLYKRLTMTVIDGLIEHVFYPVFPPNEHAQQVLDWLNDADR